jgi:oxaloacetate decarboxylase gamma subunit
MTWHLTAKVLYDVREGRPAMSKPLAVCYGGCMQGDIVAQGLELMVYGMSTVVLFLALLVLSMGLMSRCIARFFPDPVPEPRSRAAGPAIPAMNIQATDDPNLVAVISAAVHQHRRRGK